MLAKIEQITPIHEVNTYKVFGLLSLSSNGCRDSKKVVDAFHIKMKDISEFGQIISNGRTSFRF